MAKIYRVTEIKLDQLVSENVHMITDLPTKRIKRYHSDLHFSEFLPTRWQKKSTGIDMKQKLRHCHSMYSFFHLVRGNQPPTKVL